MIRPVSLASDAVHSQGDVEGPGPAVTLEAVGLTRPGSAQRGDRPDAAPPAAAERGRELSLATDALRRIRLRAAAGFLTPTLGVLVVWRAFTGGGPLLVFQAAVVAILWGAYATLAGRTRLSARRLRGIEFTVFALTSAYLAARQYQGVFTWIESFQAAGGVSPAFGPAVASAFKSTLIGTMLLTFAYGMLDPNSGRAAGLVVLAITAVPVVTEAVLVTTNVDDYRRAVSAYRQVAEDATLMLLGGGLSVYGTHVINGLRTEAFQARQLNQYWLVRRLGTGGMGEVYLAEHRLLKRTCAVKIIRPGQAADPIELARFEREVRATARLSHPNTVEVFDYGRTEDGTFFYVMEFLPGLSLDEVVKRHGPMPPGRVIYLLRQVCGALAEAHAAGLVHRDVKPGNIFASYRGGKCDVAKLLDFGLVHGPALGRGVEPTDVSREGMIRGTPLYMAPEQILGDGTLDRRCDLYALGAVAYRLLTGVPPFVRDSRMQVMSAHAYEPVLPPSLRNPAVPADLERVVLRCLAKSPDGRYPDADALERALAACESAVDWDAEKAALWWVEFEPIALDPLSTGLV